jgi:hypothetical protein
MSTLFGKKDLALFLPDKAGDLGSLRHTESNDAPIVLEALKPKIDSTKKVNRYFPGRAPSWIEPEQTSIQVSKPVSINENKKEQPIDRRLQRLSEVKSIECRPNRRVIYDAEIIAENISDSVEKEQEAELVTEKVHLDEDEPDVEQEDDEDDIAKRRSRMLARAVEREQSISSSYLFQSSEPQNEESEYETDDSSDSESEELKPVFVPKHGRITKKDEQNKVAAQQMIEKKREIQMIGRQQQTREIVAEAIRRNEEAAVAANAADDEDGRPDDFDDPDLTVREIEVS